MAKIAISGRNLHEVMMRQRNPFPGNRSYLSYPEHRIGAEIEGGRITLTLPPLLAVELYRTAVIHQEEGVAFPVKSDGRDLGLYRVVDFRYPATSDVYGPVTIELSRLEE
jgi:hypothetical protein